MRQAPRGLLKSPITQSITKRPLSSFNTVKNYAKKPATLSILAGTGIALTTTAGLYYYSKSESHFLSSLLYADADDTQKPAPEEHSKEIEEKVARKIAKQKLPDPSRKVLYVSPDGKWTVYGSKDVLRLVKDDITGKIKKRGYGWSGCASSQTHRHFWVVADTEKKFLFKVNFDTGTVSRLVLDKEAKLTDLEAVTSVPHNCVDDPKYEELFLVCSSSTNAPASGIPKTERCRISFVQIPVQACHEESPESKKIPKDDKKSKKDDKKSSSEPTPAEGTKFESFQEGVSQFTIQDVRSQILNLLLSKHSTIINTSNDLISKAGGLDIEGACFVPAANPTDTHKLYLGLRGPQTTSKRAVLLHFNIPLTGKRDPKTWVLNEHINTFDLEGFAIRDMTLSNDQKSIYLLAGSLGQDKTVEEIDEYPIYEWVINGKEEKEAGGTASKIGAVPRVKAGDLQHSGLSATAWEEYGMKEGDVENVEQPGGWSSPEGIDVYRDEFGKERLLCVWDNNDVGVYADVDFNDVKKESKSDRVGKWNPFA